MTRHQHLSIFNQLRPVTVGFDPIFDQFERMFNGDENLMTPSVNYPPYNIVKTGDFTYNIEVALAGFNRKDIEVNYADNTLEIKSIHEKEEAKEGTLHQGISKRHFTRSFTIAEDVEVKGAELKDGLLQVELEKIIPESKKTKNY
jgi:molecular chaperone IbpA